MDTTNKSGDHRRREHFRVLLIESNEETASAIRRALVDAGSDTATFEVVCRRDPPSALATLESGELSFDVAVVSGAFPEASCLEFRKRVCEKEAFLPVVLSFDAGREKEAAEALCVGADDIFIKDEGGGYLGLLPELLANVARRSKATRSGLIGQLAVIVRSDPRSTEYKRAERALIDSEPIWRALVESPFERVMLVDRAGIIQYVNKLEHFEFSDLIGKKSVFEFIPPDQLDAIRKKFESIFGGGKPDHYEVYIPHMGKWFSSTIGPVFEGGNVIGASIFSRDITEQKRVENQLKESERRFRQLARAIRDVFYILDPLERKAIYVSPGYKDVYGRSLESVYANPLAWMEAVHPEDRGQVIKDFETMLGSKADGYDRHDYRIVKPDGSVRWVQHRAFVIRDERNEPVHIAGIVTDVTARKEAEKELRASEHKYRTLVNQASDAIMITNADGYLIEANDAGCEMIGYARDELFTLNFRDLIPKEDLTSDPPQLEDLRKGKLIVKEHRLVRKDGSVFAAEGSFKALPGGMIQAIIRDVTERKRMDDELRRAHDELERRVEERTRELQETSEAFEKSRRLASIGTLAAGIAHEINNPIGSILMAADMALYSLGDFEERGEVEGALKSIKEDAKRAGRIVKTVLQLSRQEVSQKWPHDLSDIARRARDITRGTAETRGVNVELKTDGDLPKVVVNPTEIEQVFVNVMNNAIEASESGQTVSVRLDVNDDDIRTVVEDNGRGMTQDEVTRVFDPFFTTRRDEGGTGLGLSLTHSIVHMHGGKIEVESVPGKGTRVTVSFPVAELQNGETDERSDGR